jgi:lipopolysaccharide/colanic/teichoic acid biosynthesis glycosyltransferase
MFTQRILDIIIVLIILPLLLPIILLLFLIIFFDTGSPIFLQKRVGLKKKLFTLIKFRTMRIGTFSTGTHLIDRSNITYLGLLFRKFKLDELPQLLNVLMNHMTLVGPRPCLPNQRKLIIERKKRGVFNVRPGMTGLAQVSGINMSTPTLLAKTDLKMIKQMNLFYYFYYIFKTFLLIFVKKS